MNAVISACLLGERCRYDGAAKPSHAVQELARKVSAYPICPEVAGGLPVPRPPAERCASRVLTAAGVDVTDAYERGAQACLSVTRQCGASLAVLRAKSPACGVGRIYDGSHARILTKGNGVFSDLLEREGVCMVTEEVVAECKPSVEHPVAIVLGTGLGHLGAAD